MPGLAGALGLAYVSLHLVVTGRLLVWLHQRCPAAFPTAPLRLAGGPARHLPGDERHVGAGHDRDDDRADEEDEEVLWRLAVDIDEGCGDVLEEPAILFAEGVGRRVLDVQGTDDRSVEEHGDDQLRACRFLVGEVAGVVRDVV